MKINELDPKYFPLYREICALVATESKAERKKVGAVMVTPAGIVIPSWNGTLRGFDNACEDEEGLTKPTVVHAEAGVLKKALKAGVSTEGSIMFCTYSPCIHCAIQLSGIGLEALFYELPYKDLSGIQVLEDAGVSIYSVDSIE